MAATVQSAANAIQNADFLLFSAKALSHFPLIRNPLLVFMMRNLFSPRFSPRNCLAVNAELGLALTVASSGCARDTVVTNAVVYSAVVPLAAGQNAKLNITRIKGQKNLVAEIIVPPAAPGAASNTTAPMVLPPGDFATLDGVWTAPNGFTLSGKVGNVPVTASGRLPLRVGDPGAYNLRQGKQKRQGGFTILKGVLE